MTKKEKKFPVSTSQAEKADNFRQGMTINQNKYYHAMLAVMTKHAAQLYPGLQVQEGFPADILSKLRLFTPVAFIGETILNRACNENIYLSQAHIKSLRLKELMKRNLSTSHKCPHPQVFIDHLIINQLTHKGILLLNHKVWEITLLFKK